VYKYFYYYYYYYYYTPDIRDASTTEMQGAEIHDKLAASSVE